MLNFIKPCTRNPMKIAPPLYLCLLKFFTIFIIPYIFERKSLFQVYIITKRNRQIPKWVPAYGEQRISAFCSYGLRFSPLSSCSRTLLARSAPQFSVSASRMIESFSSRLPCVLSDKKRLTRLAMFVCICLCRA